MQGKLITLYGINNIGKSTQARLLIERLEKEGYKAKYVKYPVYDLMPTGPFLNGVLRGTDGQKVSEDELQMWFVMNRYQFEPTLKKYLEEGYIVVAEDYVGTGIAWGATKGLDVEWLEQLNKFLLKEELAILFEGERKLAAKEENHVHEQDDELVERCAQVHRDLARKYGWERLIVRGKIENTANDLWEIVKRHI